MCCIDQCNFELYQQLKGENYAYETSFNKHSISMLQSSAQRSKSKKHVYLHGHE
jgi:hypothetical protein